MKYDVSQKKEIWKDIIGYEKKYQISNLGNIKSFHRKTPFLKTPTKNIKNNYFYIMLYKNGLYKNHILHRNGRSWRYYEI